MDQVRGHSPAYERLSLGVAGDPELIAKLDELPEPKRQPNLLFGAVRFLGGPYDSYEAFRSWLDAHWGDVAATMLRQRTQTNEVGRCTALLPILASLPQPIALLEVGASAGLCLYPDRYRYRYGTTELGEGPVLLECEIDGPVPVPDAMPTVVWRAGIDLNPLDVRDPDDLAWLTALVWPEQQDRRDRLTAAAAVVAADPPTLVRGDLLDELPALAATAPPDATLVVYHSAALTYLPPEGRERFRDLVTGLPGHWISNEGSGVFDDLVVDSPDRERLFVPALDGRVLAAASPHGWFLRWLAT